MHIDPHAWLITVPLTIALAQARVLPQDHFAKRWLRQIAEQEGMAWDLIGMRERPFDLADKPRMRSMFFTIAMTALILSSLVSFIAFLLNNLVS